MYTLLIVISSLHQNSAPDIKDLNIIEEKDAKTNNNATAQDQGSKTKLRVDTTRAQGVSPGVSTVAVKRKPRTQVAESLAKVIYRTTQFDRCSIKVLLEILLY